MKTDYRSAEATAYRPLYKSARWQRIRADHLQGEPLCRMCLADGLVNDGSLHSDGTPQQDRRRRFLVCDHIDPHKGDLIKFYGGPFQTLCPDHHDITKQQFERRGYIAGCDVSGRPIDPQHPWNR